MALSDPIADFLTRIRNARKAKHRFVDFPFSKIKLAIAKLLQEQGFVDKFLVNEERGEIRLFLKYVEGREPVIKGLKRMSLPSLRRYIRCDSIPKIHGGMGVAILSTSKGVVDGETARKLRVGGELLCYVW